MREHGFNVAAIPGSNPGVRESHHGFVRHRLRQNTID
jgi:hypothetical protein